MKKKEYLKIAIALPVFGTYLYMAPHHLVENACPGMRVLVPFGRRRVTGYILSRQPENNDEYRVKFILDLLDDYPMFHESMIPFFFWAANYYIHPIGEVIKSALPVGLNTCDISVVSCSEKGKKALNDKILSSGESEVINLLIKQKSMPLKTIIKRSENPGINSLVRKMNQNGLVHITNRLRRDKTRMKKEKFIVFCDLPVPSSFSAKRALILDIVKKRKEISLKKLKKEVPSAPRLVKILAESGHVKIIEKQMFRDPFGDPVEPDIPPELTEEQKKVVSSVKEKINQGFHTYLLSGVTGSGKTEVYMRLVSETVANGKSAVILVPEISLISQTERRFRARFGNTIAVIHSGLSMGELFDQWKRILNEDALIVIGARSSIFAPVKHLGLIIVDEEHDTSYKQETGFKYNARDLAVVRAKLENIPVILGSATPSVQSYYNACQGKFSELKLEKRINRHPLPQITLVDLKKYKDFRGREKIITPELSKEIINCLENGNQALIFLNRRGFATFPVCESCGEPIKCRFCDITMTLHRDTDSFKCHLCGASLPSKIKCPACGSSKIKSLGFGTEKIESMLASMFPDARIARLDQDTVSRKGEIVRILKKIRNRTVDLIVGTQMLAKGHDFPFITLVGIICADMSLNFPDFRSGERTFQLLAQVAGRAGRGKTKGKVIMQTYAPDHFSIISSMKQDFMEFYQKELPFRKALSYPPFSRIIQLKLSGKDKDKVEERSMLVGELCRIFMEQENQARLPFQILGPIEAGIPKIASRYRWQILLKSQSHFLLNKVVKKLLYDKKAFAGKDVKLEIDVDPYFMM